MIKNPRITVATLVEHNQRFQLVEECCNGKIVFNQPAGHVEEGESLPDAAKRETLEETAWQVELTGLLGVYILPMPEQDFTYYRFCYIATALTDSGEPLDTDILGAHWLSYEEILARRDQLRSPLVLQCIEDYRQGHRFPLHLIHEASPTLATSTSPLPGLTSSPS